MGITGLIPFLEKSSRKTNISEFSGATVAIDTYCWLHKGAFSCADKIIMGQNTDLYVKYCMKFVNMLLSHNIKPILVFDGRYLPAKAETESKRKQLRDANRKRAVDLIKMGKVYEGKNLLRRSLNVTHEMALEVIKECQSCNVDCIVAPYEADAQLAYLNISGIADVVITEDSDLTLFGCKKILFKMDLYGYGVLVEQDRLYLAMGMKESNFHIDKFRYMCILSGCDYLTSLPGIGLGKAFKFIIKNTDDDIYNALLRMSSSLNMKSLSMTDEYRNGFMRALATFKHQLVFCPLRRKQVRLYAPTANVTQEQLRHAGTELEDTELALQLALGNCDPFTYERLHNYDPDTVRQKRTNASTRKRVSKHTSIWSKSFKVKEIKEKGEEEKSCATSTRMRNLSLKASGALGQVTLTRTTKSPTKEATPKKRNFEEFEETVDIVNSYRQNVIADNKLIESASANNSKTDSENKSPILGRRPNPFKKADSEEVSPSLLQRVRKRLPVRSRLRPTVIDNTAIAHSKFFSTDLENDTNEESSMKVTESTVTNISPKECKENMISSSKIIIPETVSDDKMKNTIKDSGYKEYSDERDNNVSPMSSNDFIRKEPLYTIDNNSIKSELKIEENSHKIINEEESMEFSITRESFSEFKSSMFKYESPLVDKRLKKDSNVSERFSKCTTSQGTRYNQRNVKSSIKKNVTIQGQQSLLNMFGFQKKNVLKH